MHLKNFSLVTMPHGIRRLSPAYDLICTKLIIPNDTLALPIGGRNKNLTRRHWLDFAAHCQLPERAAKRLLSDQIEALEPALRLISSSFLSGEHQQQYVEFVRQNTAMLAR
jgi:serine/threonine-protein kinase HipA